MRNKKEKRFKLKRLYPARVNESDIIELKRKESMNMVVLSSEKIGKQKDTKPFSGIQTSNMNYVLSIKYCESKIHLKQLF